MGVLQPARVHEFRILGPLEVTSESGPLASDGRKPPTNAPIVAASEISENERAATSGRSSRRAHSTMNGIVAVKRKANPNPLPADSASSNGRSSAKANPSDEA